MKRWLLTSTATLGVLLFGMALVVWLLWIPVAQEPPYRFIQAWGEKGTNPGQFQDPTGIAATADEVFVGDSRNGRIQVFDHKGNFKRQFGSRGEGAGQLQRPMNLSIFGNELYVADYWNDRIQVYGLDGIHHRNIGGSGSGSGSGSGPGQFNAPGGVAVNAKGELYVADFYNQRVQHLKADGGFIEQWGATAQVGIWAEQFNYPTDVALDGGGQLFVADGYNDRIQVFDASGKFLRKWGGPLGMNIYGPFAGWFATVTSVAIGPQGNVFVADFYNNRVQKFNPVGRFITAFGSRGSGPGQFTYIMALAVAPDGTLFATDFGNNRVLSFRPPVQQP